MNIKALKAPLFKSLFAWALLASTTVSPALAVKNITGFDEPLPVQLQTPLASTATAAGSPFEAVVTEDIAYEGHLLPAGTRLKGSVYEVKPSRRLARPGFVDIRLSEASLPDGSILPLNVAEKSLVRHAGTKTGGQVVAKSLPLTAVSLAVSIPLTLATGLPWYAITPIALGSRMATGSAQEVVTNNTPQQSLSHKIGNGLWWGTGVPQAINFLGKQPEVQYAAGDIIALPLHPTVQEALFRQAPQPAKNVIIPEFTSPPSAVQSKGEQTP